MLSGLWMFVAIGKSEKSDKWIQAQRVGKTTCFSTGNSAGQWTGELESQKVGPLNRSRFASTDHDEFSYRTLDHIWYGSVTGPRIKRFGTCTSPDSPTAPHFPTVAAMANAMSMTSTCPWGGNGMEVQLQSGPHISSQKILIRVIRHCQCPLDICRRCMYSSSLEIAIQKNEH